MPYTGSGAGTIGDPYLITTQAEFLQFSNSVDANYFKLANDITFTGNCNIYSCGGILDGNNKTISGIKSTQLQIFTLAAGASIDNITIIFDKTNTCGTLFDANNHTTGNITNIKVINESNAAVVIYNTTLRVGVTMNNITAEGNIFKLVSGDINSPISNIFINLTKDYFANNGNYFICFQANANISNVQVSAISIIPFSFNTTSAEFYLIGTAYNCTISSCWFKASSRIKHVGIVYQLEGGAKLEDSYFYGKTITSTSIDPLCKQPFLVNKASYNSPYNKVSRCYSFIEEFNYPIMDVIYSGNLFNKHGYNDWYIPSFAELQLIKNLSGNALFSQYMIWNNEDFRPMSSTENDATSYKRYVGNTSGNADKVITAYGYHASSLILVRNLIDIPADKNVGQEYQNTVIIYKNGTTGIGSAKTPVANGAPIFMFGGSTSLGTTNTVGSGLANTNLMKAAITSNLSACNWETFVPTFTPTATINVKTKVYYLEAAYTYYGILNKPNNLVFQSTTNVEQELSASQFTDSNNFTTFNFVSVWTSNIVPTLINNPSVPFTLIPLIINISQVGNLVSYYLTTSLYNANDYSINVVDTSTNESIVTTIGDNSSFTPDNEADTILLFEPTILGTPYPAANKTYYYYAKPQVAETTINIDKIILQKIGTLNPNFTNLQAIQVHGSLAYNGKVYGSVRNGVSNGQPMSAPCLVIIEDNNVELIEIDCGPNYANTCVLSDFESLCRIGSRLFSVGRLSVGSVGTPNPGTNPILLIFDTEDNDYKLFKLPGWTAASAAPIHSINNYLILAGQQQVFKYDPTPLFSVETKYNLDSELGIPYEETLKYESNLYGGHITYPASGYTAFTRGVIHSITNDTTTIYVTYTTVPDSGYNATLNKSICEVHAIDLATMEHRGWSYIPFSTDDMTIIDKHLILGIEVQANANPLALGYGKSIAIIDVNELKNNNHNAAICMKPLHISDTPPTTQSYACLNFANYLFDFRTNKKVYILDTTNIDTWSEDDSVGEHTIKVLNFTSEGSSISLAMNEGILMEDNSISTFLWGAPSEYARFTVPDLELLTTLGYIGNVKIIKAYINNQQITKIL